jgi:hypothetical protein
MSYTIEKKQLSSGEVTIIKITHTVIPGLSNTLTKSICTGKVLPARISWGNCKENTLQNVTLFTASVNRLVNLGHRLNQNLLKQKDFDELTLDTTMKDVAYLNLWVIHGVIFLIAPTATKIIGKFKLKEYPNNGVK